jgi:hypothetical protein
LPPHRRVKSNDNVTEAIAFHAGDKKSEPTNQK